MIKPLLICSLVANIALAAAETDDSDIELFDDSPIKTETMQVEVISDEEFNEAIRQYPGLIEKIQTERLAAQNPYVLLPHRPNYFMPLSYQTKINQEEQEQFFSRAVNEQQQENNRNAGFENVEFVFQLSIKYIIAENLLGKFGNLAVAYTNKSFWQAYNKNISAYFRETNHEPEIFVTYNPKWAWIDHMSLSFNHQSNGQVGNLSRSWNRLILSGAKVWSDKLMNVRAWYRIPETAKADPEDPTDNDNPDIDDYLGYGDVFFQKKLFADQSISATFRNNLNVDENRGSIELDWTFPLKGKARGFVQYFNGYGESLIDYNQYQERIGVGIKIADWL